MENRRVTKQNGIYQVIKPTNNLGSTPEREKGDIELIVLEFEREESISKERKKLILNERTTRSSNRDWEYYGRRYGEIRQIVHLIRGTIRNVAYFFEPEVYDDFKRFLNNGSSLKGRLAINRNL